MLRNLLLLIPVPSTFALAEPRIVDLGVLPGGSFVSPAALSADESVVVGTIRMGTSPTRAFQWTEARGMEALASPAGATGAEANSVSADGSIIVGTVYYGGVASPRAVAWCDSNGLHELHWPAGATSTSALAVSADGSVVGGRIGVDGPQFQGLLWQLSPSSSVAGEPAGGASSAVYALSSTGAVAVGHFTFLGGTFHAARWSADKGLQDLGTLSGGHRSQALGVDSDGKIVVGRSNLANGRLAAYRWTESGGMAALAGLPRTYDAGAQGISPDGSVIGGYAFDYSEYFAVLWSDSLGVVDLNTLLPKLGVDLTGWKLEVCVAVGIEGRVLIGYGTRSGDRRGWIATGLPSFARSCAGDLDRDFLVGDADFVQFVGQYAVLDCAAYSMPSGCTGDLNHDGFVDDSDFTLFVVAYDALLCP